MHRPRSQLRSISVRSSRSLSRARSPLLSPRPSLTVRLPRVSPFRAKPPLKHKCLPTWIGKCLPTRVTYRHTCGALPSHLAAILLPSPLLVFFPSLSPCHSFARSLALSTFRFVPSFCLSPLSRTLHWPARAIHVPLYSPRICRI